MKLKCEMNLVKGGADQKAVIMPVLQVELQFPPLQRLELPVEESQATEVGATVWVVCQLIDKGVAHQWHPLPSMDVV